MVFSSTGLQAHAPSLAASLPLRAALPRPAATSDRAAEDPNPCGRGACYRDRANLRQFSLDPPSSRDEWIRDGEGMMPPDLSWLPALLFRSVPSPSWCSCGPSDKLDLRREGILEKGIMPSCGRKQGRQCRSPVEVAISEESSTALSRQCPPQLR